MTNTSQLHQFESLLKYKFKDTALLELALTHRSFKGENNERLEFLGDSILNFVVAELLFEKFPQSVEGDLSRLRSELVKASTLSEIGVEINVGNFLRLGEGELKSAGWRRPSILADTVEAVIGAIFIDSGMDETQSIIKKWLENRIDMIDPKKIKKDAKSLLQEFLQGKKIALPKYEVGSIKGEAHSQSFIIQCHIPALGITVEGDGDSRKIAEQVAAKNALIALGKQNDL
jgi:ribonuclease-3